MRLRFTTGRPRAAAAALAVGLAFTVGCDTSEDSSAAGTDSGGDAQNATADASDTTAPGDDTALPGGDTTEPVDDTSTPGSDTITEPPVGDWIVDLRADTNRSGKIELDDATEDEGEDAWSAEHGAIFLANIDDDLEACPAKGPDINDMTLPDCNDAADEVVNGPDDHLDMAQLAIAPWPGAPDTAEGIIDLGSRGDIRSRLFIERDGELTVFDTDSDRLSADELRAGVKLRLEGKDIVRNPEEWDGMLTVTLTVKAGGESASDSVELRLSPVMLYHHLLASEVVYASKSYGTPSIEFREELGAAVKASSSSIVFDEISEYDQWTQDFFETGYTSMPGPDGAQHVIRVNFRSANVQSPSNKTNPLRPAGKVVFTHLRGKDSAGVQEFDIKHDGNTDSLNSFGNTETIPPYSFNGEDYPLGRIMRGSIPTFATDEKFTRMMEAQAVQPHVYIDTSWLLVGHVDETLSFVAADNDRGWVMLRNDAMMAVEMLEELEKGGHGDVVLFEGKNWDANDPADITVSELLDDTEVMEETVSSAAEVDSQVEDLVAVTGLTEEEMVRIPYVHYAIYGYSVAYQPGTVNGIVIDNKNFGAPRTHGPVVDGKDVFKEQFETELAKVGVMTHWIEEWDLYHALLGEVHCGSNATRAIPDVLWWETGR